MKIAINRYHWIVTYLVGLVTIALLGFPSIVGAEELSNPPILAKVAPLSAESFVATAIARTGPAVVRIDTETVVTRRVDPFFDDPFFRDFFGTMPTPQQQEQHLVGQGSGFIVDKTGVILTNAHVVDNAGKVTVTLRDGRTFKGEVKGTDEVTDLAVVRIDPQGEALPVAPLGDSSQLQVGDWAIAVGNPVGLDNTVTLGIISTLGRSAAKAGIPDKRVEFIQTDAAINPGNSGGPLLNAQGEVIGINTAIRADATGIGFAIPINKAKSIEAELLQTGKVSHPFLGVQMVTLTPDMARQNNSDPNATLQLPETTGVLIVRIVPQSPAEAAGLRRGDVITKIDGQTIVNAGQLQATVDKSRVGQVLQLTIIRSGTTQQIGVKTAELNESSR